MEFKLSIDEEAGWLTEFAFHLHLIFKNWHLCLGHKISARGIEPDDAKITAILEIPEASDKKGTQRLLGLTKYVAMF